MSQTLKRSYWPRLASILISLVIAWGILLGVDIYTYSFASDPSPGDAAIVLGAAAWGTKPSPVFEERIKHAVNLYKAGQIKAIIFTGGVGKDEQLAESVVASQYAIEHGIAAKDIYCETASRLTYENLCGAKRIIQREHIDRVLIVSDPLHMRRAITIARDLGIDAYPSSTPTSRYVSLSNKIDFLWGEVRPYTTYLLRRSFRSIVPKGNTVPPCE
jgi:uncharacterized SAM-binding protein YcdF (DUF218 family)